MKHETKTYTVDSICDTGISALERHFSKLNTQKLQFIIQFNTVYYIRANDWQCDDGQKT